MISLGLIGYPLVHSLSPKLHAAALRACGLEGEYRLYPISPEDKAGLAALTERIRSGEIQGLNVTIPHKQSVMEFLDDSSSSARSIGAVNTLVWKENRLIGDNTDAPGFLSHLRQSVPSGFTDKKAIVLGAGGAARAVVYGLMKEGWHITLAVRRADEGQVIQLISSMRSVGSQQGLDWVFLEEDKLSPRLDGTGLVVNTTPLGMFPEVNDSPWPKGLHLPDRAVIYDLVYNPRQTAFVCQAQGEGLHAVSGIGMLVEQAALSFEIWTGLKPPREAMFSAVEVA